LSLQAKLAARRLNPAALRLALEIALVLALAIQAGRLVSDMLTPVGPIGGAPASKSGVADLSILARFNPFAPRGDGPVRTASGVSEGGLALFGVRADGRGGGSAIIGQASGAQTAVGVGEALPSGLILKSVGADHAILSNGARLELTRAAAGGAPTPPPTYLAAPAAAPAAGAAVSAKQFVAEAGLRPRTEDGRITGYALTPRGGGEALRRAGLMAGDVITQINGAALTAEKLGELESELATNASVQITIERGGAPRTLTLQTGG